MAPPRKFLRLSLQEYWLFAKAAGLLVFVRFSLSLLPFPYVRTLLDRAGRCSPRLAVDPPPVEQFPWAVKSVSRLIPGGQHCLSQALAVQTFLMRRGYLSKICFGVQCEPGRTFTAHAWLECNGVVLIGGDHLNRFVRLSSPADVQPNARDLRPRSLTIYTTRR